MFAWRPVAARLAVLAALLGPVAAQHTWVVDPAGNGAFVDLQTAINAAAPGDTLLVRAGSYGTVVVDRSLQLLGDGARPVVSSLTCWPGITLVAASIDLGYVTLASCTAAFDHVGAFQVRLTGTAAVFVGCRFDNSTSANGTTSLAAGSHAVFDNCLLVGSPGSVIQTLSCTPVPGAAALTIDGSSVAELADTTCAGAGPRTFLCLNSPGTSGIQVDGGGVVRARSGVVQSGGAAVPAVSGGGTVLHDGTQFVPSFAGTAAFVPKTTGQAAGPGGTLTATLAGNAAQAAALVASLGVRAPAPLPSGDAWIDPVAFVVLRIGVLDATGALQVGIPLPATLPRGLHLTAQGAVVAATGALVAATPTLLLVR